MLCHFSGISLVYKPLIKSVVNYGHKRLYLGTRNKLHWTRNKWIFLKYKIHDDVIKWKHFPRYWSFVRGIHRSPVTRCFDIFFDLRLNKRLSKQWWCWWFETPSWSLWRHCNDVSKCKSILGYEDFLQMSNCFWHTKLWLGINSPSASGLSAWVTCCWLYVKLCKNGGQFRWRAEIIRISHYHEIPIFEP